MNFRKIMIRRCRREYYKIYDKRAYAKKIQEQIKQREINELMERRRINKINGVPNGRKDQYHFEPNITAGWVIAIVIIILTIVFQI